MFILNAFSTEKEKVTDKCIRNKSLLFFPQDCKGFLSDSKNLKFEFIGQAMEGNLWLCWDFHNFSI